MKNGAIIPTPYYYTLSEMKKTQLDLDNKKQFKGCLLNLHSSFQLSFYKTFFAGVLLGPAAHHCCLPIHSVFHNASEVRWHSKVLQMLHLSNKIRISESTVGVSNVACFCERLHCCKPEQLQTLEVGFVFTTRLVIWRVFHHLLPSFFYEGVFTQPAIIHFISEKTW